MADHTDTSCCWPCSEHPNRLCILVTAWWAAALESRGVHLFDCLAKTVCPMSPWSPAMPAFVEDGQWILDLLIDDDLQGRSLIVEICEML